MTYETVTKPGVRSWYALAVLSVATVFGFVDRQILTLVVGPIKHDLALSDLAIGSIQGLGPALFAALASVPLAALADKADRRLLLACCALLWSGSTAAIGLCQSFTQIFACTIGIAMGEAAIGPIVYSLIPDLFPGPQRQYANLIYYAAAVIGAALGLLLGGIVLATIDQSRALMPTAISQLASWRIAFLLVAAPGPLIAAAIYSIGATARGVGSATGLSTDANISGYLRTHGRTAAGVYIATGFFGFALSGGATWMPVAIARRFDRSAAEVGVAMGGVYLTSAIIGLVAAMASVSYWKRRAGAAAVLRGLSTTMALASLPTLALLVVTTATEAYALAGIQYALAITGAAMSPSMYQDMAPPALRARLIAISVVIFALIGAGSPMLVGAISDAIGPSRTGLLMTIVLVSAPGFLMGAIIYRLTEKRFTATAISISGGDAATSSH